MNLHPVPFLIRSKIPPADQSKILSLEAHAIRIRALTKPPARNELADRAWQSLHTFPLRRETLGKSFVLHIRALHATGLPLRLACEIVRRAYVNRLQQ